MKNSIEGHKSFQEYLSEKASIVDKKLKPFYKRVEQREKSRMNLYGCATPKDSCLLDERAAIYSLKIRVDSCDSLDKLVDNIKEEIKVSNKTNDIIDLKNQLRCINDYLENYRNSFMTHENDTSIQPPNKKDTLSSLFEIQASIEDKSTKMKR